MPDDFKYFESGNNDRLDASIRHSLYGVDKLYIGRSSSVVILDLKDLDDFIEWLKALRSEFERNNA